MSRLTKALSFMPIATEVQDSVAWRYFDMWLKHLQQQNYSKHTINAYQTAIIRFLNFIDEDRHLSGDLHSCSAQDLTRFFGARLEETNIKAISAKQELSAIRQFYAFLIQKNILQNNPAAHYRLKSEPRALPKVADEFLIQRLLEQPVPNDASQARLWVRDKAMFELMYSSGLRLSELTNLDIDDIDFQEKIVRVLGKGKKVRLVPVGSKAIQALQNYLPHRSLWQENNSSALFISERHGTRLSTRSVQLRLIACANRAGIEQHLHPHLLRHCFASHLLSASGDLRAIQEMLGHTNISTTQIYTQVDFASLTRVYDNAHPRASKIQTKPLNN